MRHHTLHPHWRKNRMQQWKWYDLNKWQGKEIKHIKPRVEYNLPLLSVLFFTQQVMWCRAVASWLSQCLADRGFSQSQWKCVLKECCGTGMPPPWHRPPQSPGCFNAPATVTRQLLPFSIFSCKCLLILCKWWDKLSIIQCSCHS